MWKKVLDVVRISVSGANFNAWFSQTFIVEKLKNGRRPIYQIGCPSNFAQSTIESRYSGLLQDALNQVTGEKNDLVFVVKQTPHKASSHSPLFSQEDETNEKLLKKAQIPNKFSFANFAVSPSNQLAWSAATTVFKNPGTVYNPLFIWGGVGVGKTHLALALAREILTRFPNKRVLCSTGDEFIVGIIEAIKNKTTSEFKKKYRGVDVLVVDDVSFIAGKDTVQDEFFHTFNQVTAGGGQIILTSDRAPYEIDRLEPRLQSRFQGGLIVDIAPPDFELRVAILLIKAHEREIELPVELAQKIAEVIHSTRQLEGFLAKLVSRLDHQNLTPNPTTVEDLLKTEVKISVNGSAKRNVNSKDIISCICDHFSVTRKSLVSASRKKALVVPRHILMYLLRSELNLPYEEIGKLLGGRDHTTIIHGVEKVNLQMPGDGALQGNILGIKNKLWG